MPVNGLTEQDRCGASMKTDPRWHMLDMAFGGRGLTSGGFNPIVQMGGKGQ